MLPGFLQRPVSLLAHGPMRHGLTQGTISAYLTGTLDHLPAQKETICKAGGLVTFTSASLGSGKSSRSRHGRERDFVLLPEIQEVKFGWRNVRIYKPFQWFMRTCILLYGRPHIWHGKYNKIRGEHSFHGVVLVTLIECCLLNTSLRN